jgi:hypothetical protein
MAEIDDLNLPNIGPGVMLPPTPRSLDEIDAWIQEDYELFFDRESYEREKKRMTVPQQFKLD